MSITAIIAEDDLTNLELFAELLELKGIKILKKISNGKDAVTAFESHRPDVVFLDVMMPDYDGLYALEEIRKIDPNSKIVMVTADTSEETESIFEKFTPSAIVHKPYDLYSILHILENKLDLKVLND